MSAMLIVSISKWNILVYNGNITDRGIRKYTLTPNINTVLTVAIDIITLKGSK